MDGGNGNGTKCAGGIFIIFFYFFVGILNSHKSHKLRCPFPFHSACSIQNAHQRTVQGVPDGACRRQNQSASKTVWQAKNQNKELGGQNLANHPDKHIFHTFCIFPFCSVDLNFHKGPSEDDEMPLHLSVRFDEGMGML